MINLQQEMVYPANRQQWRDWSQTNHSTALSVWLVYYKKQSSMPTVTWSEAVDEALCFGWIDGIAKPIDGEKYMQYFSRRKPLSTWSKINKEKVLQLTHSGQMTEAGLKCIEVAKGNGSWSVLNEVEALIIPADLKSAFKTQSEAWQFFTSLSRSVTKAILQWLVLAKRVETRQRRIKTITQFCEEKLVPKQFRS